MAYNVVDIKSGDNPYDVDSFTRIHVFSGKRNKAEIRHYVPINGKRCTCGICNTGGDCCGNYCALPAQFKRWNGMLMIMQRWYRNI